MPPRKRAASSSPSEDSAGDGDDDEFVLDPQEAKEADQQELTEDQQEELAMEPQEATQADEDEEVLSKPAPKRRRTDNYGKKEKKSSDEKKAQGDSVKEEKRGSTESATSATSTKWGEKTKANEFNPRLPTKITPRINLGNWLDKQKPIKAKGNVVYWMRNHDVRIGDNHALSVAASQAKANGGHLIALHVISPEDYDAHDLGPRLVDFILRNLKLVSGDFKRLNIPFVVRTHAPRTEIASKVVEWVKEWGATHLYGNIEYEVDELWRDAAVVEHAINKGDLHVNFLEDMYVVRPGTLVTKAGKPYAVFSPWHRSWLDYIDEHPDETMIEYPNPEANEKSIYDDKTLGALFDEPPPESVSGFECKDKDEMERLWPAGEETSKTVLQRFMFGKAGLPFLDGAATADDVPLLSTSIKKEKGAESRFAHYNTGRNLIAENGTSHLSPYLASGVISPRECLRQSAAQTGKKLAANRDSGPGQWNIELGFRDFYGNVLASWPRVCMGRAFVTRYEAVVWDDNETTFEAWTKGQTGYPIVDAAMRQCNAQGAMHNRGRMIVAMFLTKHLLHDWKKGEKYFMNNFIDGNFASNNGGWQWSASTGTDPQPYFRIFNPVSQSKKCDPKGDYIRYWVPELKSVKGDAIHMPFESLDKSAFKKLGYPEPIVDHKFARERALDRFREPGTK